MTARLRIGVPGTLLELTGDGGHARVWSRVLAELARIASVAPLERRPGRRRRWRAPDVVLCSGHEELPDAGPAPVVAQLHEAGWFTPQLRAVLDPDFLGQIAPLTERAARSADQLIVPSRAAAADLIDAYGIPADRVHAVPHGVDPVFAPGAGGGGWSGGGELVASAGGAQLLPSAGATELIARAGGAVNRPYILYAATVHPRKNLVAVRDAVAALADEGLPHQLAIVGVTGPRPRRFLSA